MIRTSPLPFQPLAEPGDETLDQPPVRWRELLTLLALVAACDVAIYRAHGFMGFAALLVVAPGLLWLASPWKRGGGYLWLLAGMLAVLAARLAWCGSALQVAVGCALLVAFAQCLCGMRPFVLEGLLFASQTILAGCQGLARQGRFLARIGPPISRAHGLSVVLPLVALSVFGLLFVLANPDLVSLFNEGLSVAVEQLRDWLTRFAPSPWECLFWVAALWIIVGLTRPIWRGRFGAPVVEAPSAPETAETAVYPAARNTLIALTVLFAVYLGFEFQTLWFREFPPGFYYAGYAHQGAAWLTVSLALATVVLSALFQGRILRDPRLPRLRRLAWLWSLENVLLAAAVYHRLFIYIGFNGLTRLRIVALFGISAVLAGFLLVVWKIVRDRDFLWLIRRQMWALGLTIYLFALTPIDALTAEYNVRRVLAGDPKPSVQLIAHPIGPEGIPRLRPLLAAQDVTIREGVRALLAQHDAAAEKLAQQRDGLGWSAWQGAEQQALAVSRADRSHWADFADASQRDAALERFREYAYQWY